MMWNLEYLPFIWKVIRQAKKLEITIRNKKKLIKCHPEVEDVRIGWEWHIKRVIITIMYTFEKLNSGKKESNITSRSIILVLYRISELEYICIKIIYGVLGFLLLR